jgi:hypothetical protein
MKRYPTYVMQFDHVRGVKEFEIGQAQRLQVSTARLFAEIAKCDLVCANCHMERTHGPDQRSAQMERLARALPSWWP